MAGKYSLTLQLQLQSPNNVAQVVSGLQKQLGAVAVNLQVKNSKQAAQQVQQLTNATNDAKTAAEKMGDAFGVSLKRFAAFSLASRAIGVFTRYLSNAVDESINFDRQLNKIRQVTRASQGSLNDLSKEITRLATTFGVASSEITDTALILAQAGLSATDTKVALEALTKTRLSATFGDINETAEGAVALIAQFGEGAGALERQLGSLNAVSAKFAVESADLIEVIRRTGGVFKASGGSLEELFGLFTSVRATTRESAESIATALKTIFTRIQRPQTIQYLKQLGVELVNAEGAFVGPYEAIRRLSTAFGSLEQGSLKFIEIAEELGGYRQIGKVIPLLQQFTTAERARQAALAGGTSLTEEAAIAQESLAVQFQKVREEFLSLIRSTTQTDTFKVLTKTVLSLATSLIKVADALKPVLPLLAAFAAIKFTRNIGGFFGGIGTALQRKQFGGKIHAFASGGMVPGSGNRDTVPAMLTPGEFVIRKSSVKKLGAGTLAAMNENRYNKGTVGKGVKPSKPLDLPTPSGKTNFTHVTKRLTEDDFSRNKSAAKFLREKGIVGIYNNMGLDLPQEWNSNWNKQKPDFLGAYSKTLADYIKNNDIFKTLKSGRKKYRFTGRSNSIAQQLLNKKDEEIKQLLYAKLKRGSSVFFDTDPDVSKVLPNLLKDSIKQSFQGEKGGAANTKKLIAGFQEYSVVKSEGERQSTTEEIRKKLGQKNFFGGAIQRFNIGGQAKARLRDIKSQEGSSTLETFTSATTKKGGSVFRENEEFYSDGDFKNASNLAKLKSLKQGLTEDKEKFGGAFLFAPSAPNNLVGQISPQQIAQDAAKGLLTSKQSINNFKSIYPASESIKIETGILNNKIREGFENSLYDGIISTIQNSARQLALQTEIDLATKNGDMQAAKILNTSNIDQTIGNIFEATLKNAGGVFDERKKNENFDFPSGLGDIADNFTNKNLSFLSTDAKATYNQGLIKNLLGKIETNKEIEISKQLSNALKSGQRFALGGVVQRFARGGKSFKPKRYQLVKGVSPTANLYEGMSEEQIVADYVLQGSEKLNSVFNKNPVRSLNPKQTKSIVGKLSSAATDELPPTLFHGFSYGAWGQISKQLGLDASQDTFNKIVGSLSYKVPQDPELAKSLIGKAFSLPGFLSTSVSDRAAARFMAANTGGLLTILTNKAKKGINVSKYAGSSAVQQRQGASSNISKLISEEQEYILTKGNRFSIKGISSTRLGTGDTKPNFTVQQFAKGGAAPSDTVPALLTPGEFVFSKKAAQSIGYGALNKMNKQGVTGYAKGGPVAVKKFANGGGAGDGTWFAKLADRVGDALDGIVNRITGAGKKIEQKAPTGSYPSYNKRAEQAYQKTAVSDASIDQQAEARAYGASIQAVKGAVTKVDTLRSKRDTALSARKDVIKERDALQEKIKGNPLLNTQENIKKIETLNKEIDRLGNEAKSAHKDLQVAKKDLEDSRKEMLKQADAREKSMKKSAAGASAASASTVGSNAKANGDEKTAGPKTTKSKFDPATALIGIGILQNALVQMADTSGYANDELKAFSNGLIQVTSTVGMVGVQFNTAAQQLKEQGRFKDAAVSKGIGIAVGGLAAIGSVGSAIGSYVSEKGNKQYEKAVAGAKTSADFAQVQAAGDKNVEAQVQSQMLAGGADIGTYASIGAAIGSIFGPVGTAVGALVGALGGLVSWAIKASSVNEEAIRAEQNRKDADVAATLAARDSEKAFKDLERGAGRFSGPQGLASFTKTIAEANKQQIEAADKTGVSQEVYDKAIEESSQRVLQSASIIGQRAQSEEDARKQIEEMAKASGFTGTRLKELTKQAGDAAASAIALRKSQEALYAVNLDNARLSSAFNAATLSVKNFMNSLEVGSVKLENTIGTLETASQNINMSGEANAAIDEVEKAIKTSLNVSGSQSSANTGLSEVATRQADRARAAVAINKNVETALAGVSLTQDASANKDAVKKALLDQIPDNIDPAVQEQLKAVVGNIGDITSESDLSNVIKTIQDQLKTSFIDPLTETGKALIQQEKVKIELARKRIDAENKLIEAQKSALDLQLESQKTIAEFGGKKVTPADEFAIRARQFDVGGRAAGVGTVGAGTAEDIRRVSEQVRTRFAAQQKEFGTGGQGGGAAELDKDQRERLKKANQDLIALTRQRIEQTKQELQIIKEKNALEKSSIDKLLGGDVEGFMQDQAAASAAQALRSGNTDMLGMFSTQTLGQAAKSLEGQLTPQEFASVLGPVLGRFGIQDSRSAQVYAGATQEEQALMQRGQQEAGLLAELGQNEVGFAQMELKSAEITIQTANVEFQKTLQEAAAKDRATQAAKETVSAQTAATQASQQAATQAATPPVVNYSISDEAFKAVVKAVGDNQKISESLNMSVEDVEKRRKALNLNRGGVVYANRGIFVPRGTDRVPAMLTPGEFVVRREAVQSGNNLQILQAMNRGGAAGSVLSNGVQALAGGGTVQNITNNNNNVNVEQFSAAVNKLQEAISQIPREFFHQFNGSTSMNVTGLAGLTDVMKNIASDAVSQMASKMKTDVTGNVQINGSVLG